MPKALVNNPDIGPGQNNDFNVQVKIVIDDGITTFSTGVDFSPTASDTQKVNDIKDAIVAFLASQSPAISLARADVTLMFALA